MFSGVKFKSLPEFGFFVKKKQYPENKKGGPFQEAPVSCDRQYTSEHDIELKVSPERRIFVIRIYRFFHHVAGKVN